jgi:hypothetical protein
VRFGFQLDSVRLGQRCRPGSIGRKYRLAKSARDPSTRPHFRLHVGYEFCQNALENATASMEEELDSQCGDARQHEQSTRFVCVEGWSAIAWWAGLQFDDLLRAYPPISQAKWARVESSVNLDVAGNPDLYFVSIDLATARHPQTLLATHHSGQPLTVKHGTPLRLLVPIKLGLKNVKAVTRITYSAEEPKDYWAPYGYSSYDGV